jgi:hypothetical protein
VLTEERVCPFCGILLPSSFRGQAAPPLLPGRLGRAALLAAGATLMAAGACNDGEGNSDAAGDRQTMVDSAGSGDRGGGDGGGGGSGGMVDASGTGGGGGAATADASGTGGRGGSPGGDAAAGADGGSARDARDAADERGAVALYGAVSPDATIAPAYGIPGPTNG